MVQKKRDYPCIHDEFQIKSKSSGSFKYLGLNIEQNADYTVSVDQFDYLENFSEIKLQKGEHKTNPALLVLKILPFSVPFVES